jgi:glycosyltransferase involved in cell wall biosynthesis
MTVAYYTSTNFMDVILETIQCIKHKATLHVLIEISNQSKHATLINVDSIDHLPLIASPEEVLGEARWGKFKPYFEGVASVHFVVHRNKRSLSLTTLKNARAVGMFLKKFPIDVFHFDTISPRAIGLYPYLRKLKVVIALHDPVPHTGEYNWREDVPNFVFYRMASSFIFYSEFAQKQFGIFYPKIRVPFYSIRLQPYTFIRQYLPSGKTDSKYILFFGRLSAYKGIDILLEAIPKVLEKFPTQQFIIAGKPAFGTKVDEAIIDKFKNNIKVISRFLDTEELVGIISEAQFVVCPYRDATQSGVLMTSFAAGKTVVASNVGSFPEYITHEKNGLLTEAEPTALSKSIIRALTDAHYKDLETEVVSTYNEANGRFNTKQLLSAYQHT